MSILKSTRAQFYSIYWGSLITKSRYDEVVQNFHQYRTTVKKSQDMKNNYKRYSLGTHVRNNELFRQLKVVNGMANFGA
jgi:hypothetical protein